MVKLGQIVRAHQPDKPHTGVPHLQCGKCLSSIARAQIGLHIGDRYARILDHRLRARHTLCQRCGALFLDRVAGANQPPQPGQPETFQGFA